MRRLHRSITVVLTLPLANLSLAPLPATAQLQKTFSSPSALVTGGVPVDWIFVFKQNAAAFPTKSDDPNRNCAFGGAPKSYTQFGQQFATASSLDPILKDGLGLAGTSDTDPMGATFSEIYTSSLSFVVWNDQLYRHPTIAGCTDSCSAPWGHSKGILAWNELGEGVVLQVTTPSWPAAGSAQRPRSGDGNTLGCVNDNNVKVSQDFFSVRLTTGDVDKVLDALANASVVTNVADPTLARIGGPAAIAAKARLLGVKSSSATPSSVMLSTGVRLISKPSALHVPPWQLVSALLGGVDLRAATWWATPTIPSTTRDTPITCWTSELPVPGAVVSAISGQWDGKKIGLKGGLPANGNHAKIGVSTSGKANYTIFGDMNQQGAISGNCASSQNGRGGMFFVVDNADLHTGVENLISGDAAPLATDH